MIAIIDYGMGNLRSVEKALQTVGAKVTVTDKPSVLRGADKVVLPGVGAMRPAMARLKTLKLLDAIKDSVEDGKPFLGICLGLQLLMDKSNEGGNVKGLGLIAGDVVRFTTLKVPHMGWNSLTLTGNDCPLLNGINPDAFVYFCHSYYVRLKDKRLMAAATDYGRGFTSCVWSKNIFGVQFHPEKSQDVGLKILTNFTRL